MVKGGTRLCLSLQVLRSRTEVLIGLKIHLQRPFFKSLGSLRLPFSLRRERLGPPGPRLHADAFSADARGAFTHQVLAGWRPFPPTLKVRESSVLLGHAHLVLPHDNGRAIAASATAHTAHRSSRCGAAMRARLRPRLTFCSRGVDDCFKLPDGCDLVRRVSRRPSLTFAYRRLRPLRLRVSRQGGL